MAELKIELSDFKKLPTKARHVNFMYRFNLTWSHDEGDGTKIGCRHEGCLLTISPEKTLLWSLPKTKNGASTFITSWPTEGFTARVLAALNKTSYADELVAALTGGEVSKFDVIRPTEG